MIRGLLRGLVVAVTVLTLSACDRADVEPPPSSAPLHQLVFYDNPRALPDWAFQDGARRNVRLADKRGKVVVLNLWATWCGPCRKEMPTLDQLQHKLGGSDFEVVALSVDSQGVETVRKFFQEIGARNLAIYMDPSMLSLDLLKVRVLPTTLLIDTKGREIGRMVGAAEWDSPEMVKIFRNEMKK